MAPENKTILRTMLLAISAGLDLLLIPWLPVAIWCGVFVFGDPMPENFGALFWSGKVIPSFVLVYPILLVHGVISSWQARFASAVESALSAVTYHSGLANRHSILKTIAVQGGRRIWRSYFSRTGLQDRRSAETTDSPAQIFVVQWNRRRAFALPG